MGDFENNIATAHGTPARYADHQVGETVRYRVDGGEQVRSGMILFVQEPGASCGSTHTPLTYVIESGRGFPDYAWQTDIVEDTGEEPTLTKCPYCPGHHSSGQIEQCPFKPRTV